MVDGELFMIIVTSFRFFIEPRLARSLATGVLDKETPGTSARAKRFALLYALTIIRFFYSSQ